MQADRWQRIEDLYHRASQLTGGERARFLDDACLGDAQLRGEVASLLAYETVSEAFIELPAADAAARLMIGDPPSPSESMSGATVGQFRVSHQIGQGGMGVVYEAQDTKLGRTVALKFLPATVATDPRAMERLVREARAASALNHPNICTIYSVQDGDGSPFIEMERLEGETLRARLAGRPLAIDDVVAFALQMVDALDAAHARRIVHRDVKPGNVFCTDRGVKIVDFGIATREFEGDGGSVMGTAPYMSPEQARGETVDGRTDLFSLGAVMYEMATGRPAFRGDSTAAIRSAVLHDEPVQPRQLNARVPASLERIIVQALKKSRDDRYQSAAAMKADLQRLQQRRMHRGRALVAIAAALVVLAGGVIAFRYSTMGPGDLFSANLRIRQVTHNASEFGVHSGSISPDGRQVSYADPRGLHLLAVESGATRTIASAQAVAAGMRWDLTAGWFPDGRAFIANLGDGEDISATSVWISTAEGPPRKVREHARAFSVSPDGSWIAFATDGSRAGARDTWLMHPDGGSAHKIFDADAGTRIVGVSWAPDSRHVAYLRADTAGIPVAIDTRDIIGGAPSELFRPGERDVLQGAAWLRDGRLVYSLRRPERGTSAGTVPCSHSQLLLHDDGRPRGESRPLAGWLPQCVAAISFTADGKGALYLQFGLQDAIHIVGSRASGNRVNPRRLTFTEGRNIPSGWTTDSQSLVFMSDGGGRAALYTQGLTANSSQLLTNQPGIVGAARLTPDGSAVLYVVEPFWRGSTTQRLMRVALTGGPPQAIASGAFVDGGARCTESPVWLCAVAERSADSRQLVFTAIGATGARERELTRIDVDPAADHRWALSPDGSRIAVLDARGTRVRIVSLAGLSSHEIDLAGNHRLGYVSFTSDSTGIIVPTVNPTGASLLSVDFQGNTTVLWQQFGAVDVSGIPSRDGHLVAVWVRSRNASLWLAETP
jgi:hypothetical protein